MRLAPVPVHKLLAVAGSAYFAAVLVLFVTRTPLGSPLFLSLVAVMVACYVATLAGTWSAPSPSRSLLLIALAFAVAYRAPLAVAAVGPDSDMVRYLWDGRVQHLGYNPYQLVPADPALSQTHTAETAVMPSRRHKTPYPPGAQLFFRFVVATANTTLGMKLALVACDLLTIAVLWKWLLITGRNQWLVLAYAWSPLVVLEIAHSGHIDALGTLWIAAAAYWLTRGRTALACVAFVLAAATKLLPIVLAPLFLGRVRKRDLLLAVGVAVVLALPFTLGGDPTLGAIPNVVANIRFNSPVFHPLAWAVSPHVAAAVALLSGLGVATWARLRLPVSDPAAWAWPMAVSLIAAPVIYPWYLLYLTPFLVSVATLPLTVWTITVLPVYIVWHLAREGGRWTVPVALMAAEYGAFIGAWLVFVRWRLRRAGRGRS
jgi:hypothetical protein